MEGVQGSESTLHANVMVDTQRYAIVQTQSMHNANSDMSMQFNNYNTSTTLVQDFDSGEAAHVWRQGVYGKSLYPILNFVVNLKLLYKIKFIFKKAERRINSPSQLSVAINSLCPFTWTIGKGQLGNWKGPEMKIQAPCLKNYHEFQDGNNGALNQA